MSELIEKLERASRGNVTPMGFGGAGRKEKVAPMLLMGSARVEKQEEARRIVEAGLDGALLVAAATTGAKQVKAAVKLMGKLPWGLWQPVAIPTAEEGSDFQVIASDAMPLSLLDGDERTNVLAVTTEMSDSQLRTMDELPVDVFLLSLDGPTPLTVGHLMDIARVRRFTSKYLLLHLAAKPSVAEMKQFRDAGVQALAIDAAGQTAETLKACQAQLLDLPLTQPRKRERSTATLPSLQPGVEAHQHEEEEEEEYDE